LTRSSVLNDVLRTMAGASGKGGGVAALALLGIELVRLGALGIWGEADTTEPSEGGSGALEEPRWEYPTVAKPLRRGDDNEEEAAALLGDRLFMAWRRPFMGVAVFLWLVMGLMLLVTGVDGTEEGGVSSMVISRQVSRVAFRSSPALNVTRLGVVGPMAPEAAARTPKTRALDSRIRSQSSCHRRTSSRMSAQWYDELRWR